MGDQFLGVCRYTMTVDMKVFSKCMRNKATLFDQLDNICYIQQEENRSEYRTLGTPQYTCVVVDISPW